MSLRRRNGGDGRLIRLIRMIIVLLGLGVVGCSRDAPIPGAISPCVFVTPAYELLVPSGWQVRSMVADAAVTFAPPDPSPKPCYVLILCSLMSEGQTDVEVTSAIWSAVQMMDYQRQAEVMSRFVAGRARTTFRWRRQSGGRLETVESTPIVGGGYIRDVMAIERVPGTASRLRPVLSSLVIRNRLAADAGLSGNQEGVKPVWSDDDLVTWLSSGVRRWSYPPVPDSQVGESCSYYQRFFQLEVPCGWIVRHRFGREGVTVFRPGDGLLVDIEVLAVDRSWPQATRKLAERERRLVVAGGTVLGRRQILLDEHHCEEIAVVRAHSARKWVWRHVVLQRDWGVVRVTTLDLRGRRQGTLDELIRKVRLRPGEASRRVTQGATNWSDLIGR